MGRHLGSSPVCDLVLPHWIFPECGTYQYRPRARWINVPFRTHVHVIYFDVWVHVRNML
jgi:hypothetical protein